LAKRVDKQRQTKEEEVESMVLESSRWLREVRCLCERGLASVLLFPPAEYRADLKDQEEESVAV
jgi:hypothetical protein